MSLKCNTIFGPLLHLIGIAMAWDWEGAAADPKLHMVVLPHVLRRCHHLESFFIPSQCDALQPRDFHDTNGQHVWVHGICRGKAVAMRRGDTKSEHSL